MFVADLLLTISIWLISGLLLAILVMVVLSWLIAFDVVSPYNRTVAKVSDFLDVIIGPLITPIRAIVPNLGGIDISPMILGFILVLVRNGLTYLKLQLLLGY